MRRQGSDRGFTIIEALVAIGIVALLLAVIVPQVGKVRVRAHKIESLSNLRQHGATFSAYTNDYAGVWPYYMNVKGPTTLRSRRYGGTVECQGYFWGSDLWNYALADQYYEGDPFAFSFYPRGWPSGSTPRPVSGPTPYVYSCAFITDPAFYDPRTRTATAIEQWRPTRVHEVVFPSSKILLGSSYPIGVNDVQSIVGQIPTSTDPVQLACVDGSARPAGRGGLTDGYFNGDGPWAGLASGHEGPFPPGAHTIGGVRGRDLR